MTFDSIRASIRVGSGRRAAVHNAVLVVLSLAVAAPAVARGAEPPALRLPPDAVYDRVVGPDSAVVFRHSTHVALVSNRCTECHPRRFRILGPTVRISHVDMRAGRSCGACHDGQHAFGVKDAGACGSCHTGRPSAGVASPRDSSGGTAAPGAFRGPPPIVYTASEVSPGTVTFRHATHAKGECSGCHPKLFAMKSSAAKPRDGMHEVAACGACHDGKHAFSVESESSCERCHHEKGGAK